MSAGRHRGAEPDRRAAGSHFSCVMSALLLRKVSELGGAVAVAELLARSGTTRTRDYLTNVGNWISYDEAGALWTAAIEVTHHPSLARAVGAQAGAQLGGSQVASLLRSLGSPQEVYRQLVSTVSKYTAVVQIGNIEIGPGSPRSRCVRSRIPAHRAPVRVDDGPADAAAGAVGLPAADIRHDACAALGASECRYTVTWELDDVTTLSPAPDWSTACRASSMRCAIGCTQCSTPPPTWSAPGRWRTRWPGSPIAPRSSSALHAIC